MPMADPSGSFAARIHAPWRVETAAVLGRPRRPGGLREGKSGCRYIVQEVPAQTAQIADTLFQV